MKRMAEKCAEAISLAPAKRKVRITVFYVGRNCHVPWLFRYAVYLHGKIGCYLI